LNFQLLPPLSSRRAWNRAIGTGDLKDIEGDRLANIQTFAAAVTELERQWTRCSARIDES
jgi:hypothetical protein